MTLRDDLAVKIRSIFRGHWATRDGTVVPGADDLQLTNDGVSLSGVVLYADLAGSTDLVNRYSPEFAAEVYKAFLYCCARIIRSEAGEITAYDGDRIMAVYMGDGKNTRAVRAAMKIRSASSTIVQKELTAQYNETPFRLRFGIGIDASQLFVARTGIRGDNDLVWVGRAANYAAKLSDRRDWPNAIHITGSVYDAMNRSVRFFDVEKEDDMWSQCDDIGTLSVYKTHYSWAL